MPHAGEFPGMLGAVVPLMSGEGFRGLAGGVVHNLVDLACGRSRWLSVPCARRGAWRCPSFAAVLGPLNDLAEPAAALRGIEAIRVRRRSLEVGHLPARKGRAADIPLFALAL